MDNQKGANGQKATKSLSGDKKLVVEKKRTKEHKDNKPSKEDKLSHIEKKGTKIPKDSQLPVEDERSQVKKKGGWVYKKSLPKTKVNADESDYSARREAVKKEGYPWVSVSFIRKGGGLNCHSHHSDNTHLVIRGKIAFEKKDSAELIAELAEGKGTYNAPAHLEYSAKVIGGRDCVFVEGHQALSPTTRDRFILRKDIEWRAGAEHEGKVMQEVDDEGDVTEKVWAQERKRREQEEAEGELGETDKAIADLRLGLEGCKLQDGTEQPKALRPRS